MSESDERRPLSFIDDEDIEIKPSTELIPDEYERKNNENVLVELICKQTDEYAKSLANQLTNLGYSVNKSFTERINNINEVWISNFVASVIDKTKQKSYDGLLMIFAKVPLRNDVLKTIWGNFTSTKCPSLKNKPKIFIFQILKRGLEADVSQISLQTDVRMAYDTPSEADILIVYDKIPSASSSDFLAHLCVHIKDYGRQEDILNLVSLSNGSETRPLAISTMTRKFFFILNEYRGHHHNINKKHAEIKQDLENIIKFVKNMPDYKSKDKEKSLMSSVIKRFSSFRHKNHHQVNESDDAESKAQESKQSQPKLNQEKKENNVFEPRKLSEVKDDKAIAGSSKGKPKPLKPPVEPVAVPPNQSPTRKSSIPTPTRKNSTRTRFPSSSFSSKEDLFKKPPWRN